MNTVSSSQLLNQLLSIGSMPDAGLPVELDASLQLPASLSLDSLPPELTELLTDSGESVDFTALMQQQLAAENPDDMLGQQAEGGDIALIFNGLRDSLGDEGLPGDELSGPSASKETVADAVAEDILPDWLPPTAQPRSAEAASVRSVSGEDARLAHGVAAAAAVLARGERGTGPERGGERLPPLRQAAAAEGLTDGEMAETMLAAPKDATGMTKGTAVLSVRPEIGDASAGLRKEIADVRTGEMAAESEDMADDSRLRFLLRNADSDDGVGRSAETPQRPLSAELLRNDSPAGLRSDAPQPMQATMKPGDIDAKGMNELPPEMRQMQLSPRAGDAAWGRELGERVGFLLHNNMKQAEIRLDPPHLGKLEIQLQVQDDKAVVHIQTQTAQTRDLVDASLLRLRDALQDAGYSQVDVNVSQRNQSMAGQDGGDGRGFAGQGGGDGPADAETVPPGMSRHEIELTARMQGRIDYFA